MRAPRLCVLSGLALSLAVLGPAAARPEPGDKLKEQILGKWVMEKKEKGNEAKMVLDFRKDGKLAFVMDVKVGENALPTMKGEGSYKVLGDDEIETTMKNLGTGKEETDKAKVTIKGDEMTIKEAKGEAMTFKRVKADKPKEPEKPQAREAADKAEKPADTKLKDAIIGKWEAEEMGIKFGMEFTRDGKLKFSVGGNEIIAGTYKVLSETEIEVTGKGPDGKEMTDKAGCAIKGDEMTLKDPMGKELKFKRVK
jgi:uncharacterized protein (TIGR03066 family)